jgi:SnoaL-like domain
MSVASPGEDRPGRGPGLGNAGEPSSPEGPSDTDELRALSAAYAAAVDGRDGEGFAELFVETGELLVPDSPADGHPVVSRAGTDSLRSVPEGLRRFERTFHQVSNHRFSIDGDRATGDVYCIAHHVSAVSSDRAGTTGTAGTDTVWFIRYDDRYARTRQGWRFERRALHLQWVEERPVSVLPDRAAGPPAGS